MRLLLDANLSPDLATLLGKAGYDVAHVRDLGLLTAEDPAIFDRAAADGYVVITCDSDFPMLLAFRRTSSPSVVLLRHVAELGPEAHSELLIANLPSVVDDLEHGAIVSLSPTRLLGGTARLRSRPRTAFLLSRLPSSPRTLAR